MKTTTSRRNATESTFRNSFICLSLILGLFVLGSIIVVVPDAAFFEAKVLPLLQKRCYECHSPEKKIKGGLTFGATDDMGYRAVSGKVHIHDLHATILHHLGIDHLRLTLRHLGRDFRLTDVFGEVVRENIA